MFELAFDLAQFDAETADLNLRIDPPDKFTARGPAVGRGQPARQIAGAVDAPTGVHAIDTGQAGQKAFTRQVGALPVALGHTDATDIEFTRHADRHQLLLPIKQIDRGVGQRMAESDRDRRITAHLFVGRHIDRRRDRRFGRAVGTEEDHGMVAQRGPGTQGLGRGLIAADQKNTQMGGEAQPLAHQIIDPLLPERHRKIHDCYPLLLAEGEEFAGREPCRVGMQHQRCATGEDRKKVDHGGVKAKRNKLQQPIGGTEFNCLRNRLHGVGHASMRDNHPLRQAS